MPFFIKSGSDTMWQQLHLAMTHVMAVDWKNNQKKVKLVCYLFLDLTRNPLFAFQAWGRSSWCPNTTANGTVANYPSPGVTYSLSNSYKISHTSTAYLMFCNEFQSAWKLKIEIRWIGSTQGDSDTSSSPVISWRQRSAEMFNLTKPSLKRMQT